MLAGFHVFCCSLNSVLCEMEVLGRQAHSVIRVVPLMVWQMGFQGKRCFRAFRWNSLMLLLGYMQCPHSGLCADQECSSFFLSACLIQVRSSIHCCWMQWHWDPLLQSCGVQCRLTALLPSLASAFHTFVPLPLVGSRWSLKSQTTFCPKHCRFLYKNHLLRFRLLVFLAAASGEEGSSLLATQFAFEG